MPGSVPSARSPPSAEPASPSRARHRRAAPPPRPFPPARPCRPRLPRHTPGPEPQPPRPSFSGYASRRWARPTTRVRSRQRRLRCDRLRTVRVPQGSAEGSAEGSAGEGRPGARPPQPAAPGPKATRQFLRRTRCAGHCPAMSPRSSLPGASINGAPAPVVTPRPGTCTQQAGQTGSLVTPGRGWGSARAAQASPVLPVEAGTSQPLVANEAGRPGQGRHIRTATF